MNKVKTIFILLTTLASVFAKAQTYEIDSFEGKKSKINLSYQPASGRLTISYLKDTLVVNNYMSIDDVKVQNKKLLQISYVKRAGSNQDAMNQLWLCISNGQLKQALHINSLIMYDLRPSEYSLYKLGLTLSGTTTDSYQLKLNLHREETSKDNPKSNKKYDQSSHLLFDKQHKVFYSNYENITGTYTFHNLDYKGNGKKALKLTTPVITIEKDKYYYINGNWYTREKNSFYSMLL